MVLFCHSLLSDWNHGNAHFLRGVVTELCERGRPVEVYEAADAWSIQNLIADHGEAALEGTRVAYPRIRPVRYERGRLDLDRVLDGADLVWVHEWNDPELIASLGEARAAGDFHLLFHDTHHRSASDPEAIRRFDLRHYDGVLAFGEVIRRAYLEHEWTRRAWTWHEAADPRRFRPHPEVTPRYDVVWIGNWGDDERTAELDEFLLEPVRKLGLTAKVYGVRYPKTARAALARAGVEFGGWLPNYEVPTALAEGRVTLHVPRRPYVEALPGVPTIRVFEALACGIPLICAPWQDAEGLFHPGRDYLVAHTGAEMERLLGALLSDETLRRNLAEHGRRTVLDRHTCAHRVDQLLEIERELDADRPFRTTAEGAEA